MRPDNRQALKISDLTLETVIILIFGLFMSLFGLLGFVIQAGTLPYNPDGAYGLVLVLISLQIITLGKSPFGTYRRSWSLILLGIGIAAIGTIACFIPGLIGDGVRILVGILMTAGGIALILHLIGVRAGAWVRSPGILRHLAVACGLVYLMEILFGIVSLIPGIIPGYVTAVLCTAFGISLFYLAWTLTRITRRYPRKTPGSTLGTSGTPEDNDGFFLLRDATLPTQIAVIILLGVIFILFSLLLIPVGLGIFPFSRDSQFGLLMVIMAFQVLALGKTPLGVYERSLPLMLIGLAVVSLGIYSCIIPGLITGWILLPLGIWNIIAGSTGLIRLTLPYLSRYRDPCNADHSPKKMRVNVALLHLVTIFFGINVVSTGLIPGIAVPVILFLLGLLFLLLAHTLLHLPALG
ncbi:MAG: hypothetical protein LUQ50_13745 [Methanospirillum sp.]|uniref:hypothetical protein n=1 Tax=Methanospirillum sp. TaxID=45200 RepID=UPI00236A8FFF|nr:hypothetical protein [Methanospirillum sp.]MDD1730119.1 hypothetical protein [Methanospirillum sp.]